MALRAPLIHTFIRSRGSLESPYPISDYNGQNHVGFLTKRAEASSLGWHLPIADIGEYPSGECVDLM